MLGIATGITNTSYQWQPNHVGADLKLWLRNGVGVAAAQWDDSSGNSNHVVQGTGGNQATVSGGGLEFDGSDDHYDITEIVCSDREAFMFFIVIEPDNVSNRVMLGDGTNEGLVEIQTNKRIRVKIDGDTAISPTFSEVQFPAGEKYVLGIQREAGATGNINVYKDGTLLTPTSQLADSGPIAFNSISGRGSDRYFDGHIYELLFYDTADLTTGEIGKINNYLVNKHTL